ncbi:MAG: serine protease [Oscillatoriales cyanobacterium]|nr:MAG: serine protease [Oscillatoriales cyanobacterium]
MDSDRPVTPPTSSPSTGQPWAAARNRSPSTSERDLEWHGWRFWRRCRWWAWAIAAAIVAIIPAWAVLALTFDQVDAIASQVTVVIAQGLQKGDIESRQEWNPGSGVLVAHEGQTYYALTALHVVRTRNTVYGVRTSDGEVHFIDDETDPTNIIPLGNESDRLGAAIQGMDLALVRFTSDRDYPLAVMGNSLRMRSGDRVVVSGWPNPNDDSARRERVSTSGAIAAILSQPETDGGYSVFYDNPTRRGMSGGPVLNGDGELIGIHGRGRGEEGGAGGCASETALAKDAAAELGRSSGRAIDPNQASCGMQTVHFLSAAEGAKIALTYDDPPVDEQLIARGLAQKPKADTVEDIYAAFTFDVRSLLRDQPSGGCGSVLLGEPCDRPF